MTIWFTSDHHFGHSNIIKYCNRPFVDVDDMNESMIKKWNDRVGKNELVWYVGDFCLDKKPEKFLYRLNGQKHLIKGNHDHEPKLEHGWSSIQDYREIRHEKQHIVLFHYSMRVWNRSHYGAWQLYGHSHGTLQDDLTALSIDIGVDNHDYKPISFEEVQAAMALKKPKIDDRGRGQNRKRNTGGY